MKRKYIVFGWLNGDDYDAEHPADISTEVDAKSESDAEDMADPIFKELRGTCEVVVAEKLP